MWERHVDQILPTGKSTSDLNSELDYGIHEEYKEPAIHINPDQNIHEPELELPDAANTPIEENEAPIAPDQSQEPMRRSKREKRMPRRYAEFHVKK